MNTTFDAARQRFAEWNTTPELPPGSRTPGTKATEYAYAYLKHNIVTLEIEPRTILTENAVASALDISRTPVREAFMRLGAEGLLEYLPRRGALVPEITLRSLREQAETRVVLEGYGIDWICEHEVPVAASLFASIDEQTAAFKAAPRSIPEMVSIDKEFHWKLVKATGNTEFSRLYNSLHDRQLRTGIAMFSAVPDRAVTALGHHRDIAEAVERFDREAAQTMLRTHIIDSLDAVAHAFPR